MSIENANKLLTVIENKRNNWDERSQFTIANVRNLSRSDLDTIEMYANHYIQSGGFGFSGLMDPLGGTKDVLEAYGVKSNSVF